MKSRFPKLSTWVLMIGSLVWMCSSLPMASTFAQTSSAKPNTSKQAKPKITRTPFLQTATNFSKISYHTRHYDNEQNNCKLVITAEQS